MRFFLAFLISLVALPAFAATFNFSERRDFGDIPGNCDYRTLGGTDPLDAFNTGVTLRAGDLLNIVGEARFDGDCDVWRFRIDPAVPVNGLSQRINWFFQGVEGFETGIGSLQDGPLYTEAFWFASQPVARLGGYSATIRIAPQPVPVPAGLLLLPAAMAGFGIMRWRKRSVSAGG
jgi:hypothetical protein